MILNLKWSLFFGSLEINIVSNLRSEEDSGTAQRGADPGASAQAGSSLSFHPKGPGERVFTSSRFKQTRRDVETVEPSLGELQGPDLGEICLETTSEAREGPSSPWASVSPAMK